MPKTVPPKKNAIPLLLPKCHTFADTQSFFYSPASGSKSLSMAVKLRHPVLTARCWAGWCSARLVSPRTITWRWLDRERRYQSSCFNAAGLQLLFEAGHWMSHWMSNANYQSAMCCFMRGVPIDSSTGDTSSTCTSRRSRAGCCCICQVSALTFGVTWDSLNTGRREGPSFRPGIQDSRNMLWNCIKFIWSFMLIFRSRNCMQLYNIKYIYICSVCNDFIIHITS